MLPDTIALSDGTDTITYANKVREGNQSRYYATSPQGDIAGRPTLIVTQEVTKGGIARSTAVFSTPVFDSGTGKYTRFVKTNVGGTAATLEATSVREKQLNLAKSFLTAHADELAKGEL